MLYNLERLREALSPFLFYPKELSADGDNDDALFR